MKLSVKVFSKRYSNFLYLSFICFFISSCHQTEKSRETVSDLKPEAYSEAHNQTIPAISNTSNKIQEEVPLKVLSAPSTHTTNQKSLLTRTLSRPRANQSLAPELPSTPSNLPPVEEVPKTDQLPICVKEKKNALFSFWLGFGFHYSKYSQTSNIETESGNFTDQSLSSLSVGAQVPLNDKSNIDVQYHQTSEKIPIQGETTLDKTDFVRKSIRVGYQIQFFQKNQHRSALYIGIQQHRLPLLSTDENRNLVNLLDNELMTAIIGVNYNYENSNKLTYEANLSYQQLLSASSLNGFQVNMKQNLILDTSLGLKRKFDSGFYVGLYWGLQSLDLSYELSRNNKTSSGTEKLIDSVAQIRLGWDLF